MLNLGVHAWEYFLLREPLEAIKGAPEKDSSSCHVGNLLLGKPGATVYPVIKEGMAAGAGYGRAWQELARFCAVWSKINLAWVDLLWGARVWARSRDPESLACRLDSNTSCTRRTWDSQGLGKQHKSKSDIFSL